MKSLKTLWLAGFLAFSLPASSQVTVVKGLFLGASPAGELRLYDYKTDKILGKTTISPSGNFRITFQAPKGIYRLYYQSSQEEDGFLDLIIDAPRQTITVNANIQRQPFVYNFPDSKTNQAYYDFQAFGEESQYKAGLVAEKLRAYKTSNEPGYAEAKKGYEAIISLYKKAFDRFVSEHAGDLAGKFVKNKPHWFPQNYNLVGKDLPLQHIQEYWNPQRTTTDEQMTATPLYHDLVTDYLSLFYKAYSVKVGVPKLKAAVNLIVHQFKNSPLSIKKQVFSALVNKLDVPGLAEVLEYLDVTYVDSSLVEGNDLINFTRRMAMYRNMRKGQLTPVIPFKDKSGRLMTTKDIQSPYTLIVFWNSGCDHCREQMPLLQAFLSKHPEKYKALAVSSDLTSSQKAYTKFIAKLPAMYHACDFKGYDGQAYKDYYISATPTVYMLDRDKKLIEKYDSINLFLKANR